MQILDPSFASRALWKSHDFISITEIILKDMDKTDRYQTAPHQNPTKKKTLSIFLEVLCLT